MIIGFKHPLRRMGRTRPMSAEEFELAARMGGTQPDSRTMIGLRAMCVDGLPLGDAAKLAEITAPPISEAFRKMMDAIELSDAYQAAAVSAREKSV